MAAPWEKYAAPESGPWAKYAEAPAARDPAEELATDRRQRSANQFGGLIRGAGSIGATALRVLGIDSAAENEQRRKDMDAGLTTWLGSDPEAGNYKGFKLASEVAGTMGVGGLFARGAQAVGAGPSIVNALASSGFSTGAKVAPGIGNIAADLGLRTAAGGIVGGAAAAAIDPGSAGAGATVGAVLPGAVQGLARAGGAVAGAFKSPQSRAVERMAAALDADPASVAAQLRGAVTLVPDSQPTAAQVLRTPQASVLERVVSESPGGAALKARYMGQNAARLAAVDRVAPVDPRGFRSAQDDFGAAALDTIRSGDKAARAQTSAAYEAVPQDEAALYLPQLAPIRDKFYPPGAFGPREAVDDAVRTAQQIGTMQAARAMGDAPGTQAIPQKVTLRHMDALRKSIGNAEMAAVRDPAKATESEALNQMKRAIDGRIDDVVRGDGAMDEMLPIEWANQLTAAQGLKRAQAEKFRTGPQAGAFRTGADGLPAMQGGEFSPKVWGNRPGIAADIQQFRKVLDEQPRLLGQFRSMVTTEGAGTATDGGKLTGKFVRWVENSLPGLKASFEPVQVKALGRIAADIKRANIATAAGAAQGSNTYQNASNALSLGMLDSPLLNAAADRVPVVNALTGPGLQWMRESARERMAKELAGLLADPALAANALSRLSRSQSQNRLIGQNLLRAAPALVAD